MNKRFKTNKKKTAIFMRVLVRFSHENSIATVSSTISLSLLSLFSLSLTSTFTTHLLTTLKVHSLWANARGCSPVAFVACVCNALAALWEKKKKKCSIFRTKWKKRENELNECIV